MYNLEPNEAKIGTNYVNLTWKYLFDNFEVWGREVGQPGFKKIPVSKTDGLQTMGIANLKPDTGYEWAVLPVIDGVVQPYDETLKRIFATLPATESACDDPVGFQVTATQIIFNFTSDAGNGIHVFMVASATEVNGVIVPNQMNIVHIKRSDLGTQGAGGVYDLHNPDNLFVSNTVIAEGVDVNNVPWSEHQVTFNRPTTGKIWTIISSAGGTCEPSLVQQFFDA